MVQLTGKRVKKLLAKEEAAMPHLFGNLRSAPTV